MNLTEGAAHSVVNAIGNYTDTQRANTRMKQLFKQKSLRQAMVDSVYDACFNLHLLVIEILSKYANIALTGVVSDIDIDKAQAMYNNFMQIQLSPEKQATFINSIFELNPYSDDIYKGFINKYGDEDGAIEAFGNYFGMNISELKAGILAEYVSAHLGETEADAYTCQELMKAEAQRIGLDLQYTEQPQAIIREQLEKLDLIYRTVDEIVFDTREEADLARDELSQIQAIMETISAPSANPLLSYETDLIEKRSQIEAFDTQVKEKYLEIIRKYLVSFDKKFKKTGVLHSAASREEAGQENLLRQIKKLSINNWDEYDTAVAEFQRLLPEYGLTPEQATSTQDYLDQCMDKLLVVADITFPSRERAEAALIEWKQIEPLLHGIDSPNAKSLLDYEDYLDEQKRLFSDISIPELQQYVEQFFEQKRRAFDKAFRTVGMTTYETRKEAGDKRAQNYVRALSVNSYEELEQARQALADFVPRVGLALEEAVLADQHLHQCYQKLNTVDGVVFATREEADAGRQELEQINAVMKDVRPPASDDLLSYERNLNEIKKQLEEFHTPVKQKYIDQVESYLNKFDEVFRQISVFRRAETRAEAAQAKALKHVQKIAPHNTSTYENVDQAMESLKEFLPEIGLELAQASAATEYIQGEEDRLNTVDGVVLGSREEAARAREEFAQIESIMNQIAPPDNHSLLSYERFLLQQKEIINQFFTPVKDRHLAQIDKYLQTFDEKFRRISLIKVAATREEAAKDKALKFVKGKNPETLEQVAAAREELKALLPELGIQWEQCTEAENYLTAAENKINGITSGSKMGGLFGKFKNS